MREPIDSSRWTGPEDSIAAPRQRGAFVHRYGEHQVSTEFARLAAAQIDADRQAKAIPPELLGVIGRAWPLLLSPLLLLVASSVVRSMGRDLLVQANTGYLIAWSAGVIVIALSQITSRSARLIGIRKAMLVAALLATAGVAGGYIYLAAKSHREAVGLAPERTYELYKSTGRGSFRTTKIYHQRADGTLLLGGYRAPLPYGTTCALVQRLVGEYGFSWVRVLERSRGPERHQLHWPIRREECFSDIPLSSLPR
jgi:hypothetical protein